MTARSWRISRARSRPAAGLPPCERRRWQGVQDVVLAYRSVAVFAQPDLVDLAELESRLEAIATSADSPATGRQPGDPGPL